MPLNKKLLVKILPSVQNGFTLLEILVTVIIMAIGLLGLAGLQIVSLRANNTAYLRSQAVIQAYDIIDRMRANFPGVVAGGYNSISGIPTAPDCESIVCTPTQMAVYDAQQWNTENAGLFPSGQGTVTISGNSTFTIIIAWDDNRDGIVDANDIKFSTVVRP